jgi:hypothetical protein
MLVDLTEREICLIVQSIKSLDWTYCGESTTVDSVIRKCREAARKIVAAKEMPDDPARG